MLSVRHWRYARVLAEISFSPPPLLLIFHLLLELVFTIRNDSRVWLQRVFHGTLTQLLSHRVCRSACTESRGRARWTKARARSRGSIVAFNREVDSPRPIIARAIASHASSPETPPSQLRGLTRNACSVAGWSTGVAVRAPKNTEPHRSQIVG